MFQPIYICIGSGDREDCPFNSTEATLYMTTSPCDNPVCEGSGLSVHVYLSVCILFHSVWGCSLCVSEHLFHSARLCSTCVSACLCIHCAQSGCNFCVCLRFCVSAHRFHLCCLVLVLHTCNSPDRMHCVLFCQPMFEPRLFPNVHALIYQVFMGSVQCKIRFLCF